MGITYDIVKNDVSKKLDDFFPIANSFIEVNPGKVLMPKKYADLGESILNLPIYNDDIWMISYPRTGSTWAQEMIWLLGNRLNFEGAKKIQQIRAPLIELTALFAEDHYEWVANSMGNSVDCVRNLPRPRFTRSHLPIQLLPKQLQTEKPKIIYTARNPKDLCVSFYHYCKLVHGLCGPFEEFCELFISDRSLVGSYWAHVLPFWSMRNDPNILFLKYEDMKRNLPTVIRQCAEFLNIDYKLSAEDMSNICEHLKFDKMQSNPAVNLDPVINRNNGNSNNNRANNKFIRKGQIGDWRNHISPEMSKKFDEWTRKNLTGTGLQFEYE